MHFFFDAVDWGTWGQSKWAIGGSPQFSSLAHTWDQIGALSLPNAEALGHPAARPALYKERRRGNGLTLSQTSTAMAKFLCILFALCAVVRPLPGWEPRSLDVLHLRTFGIGYPKSGCG